MTMKKTLKNEFVMNDNVVDTDSAIKEHNKIMEIEAEKFKKEKVEDKAKDIVSRTSDLEIIPINQYVLIKPYDVNPYQEIKVSESGIEMNTYDNGSCLNTDTGEEDVEEQFIKVGQVICANPYSRFVKDGDDVLFKKGNAVPAPFFNLGLYVVAETSILAVINSKLTERFNIKNYE